MPTVVNGAVASRLLQSPLQYILLDIDGVIWSGANVIDKVPETLRYLRAQGKRVRFLSNNASISRAQLAHTFTSRGIEGVREEEIYNSAYAAALRLKQRLGTVAGTATRHAGGPSDEPLVHGNVLVIGEKGLHEELQRVLAPGCITYGLELHHPEAVGGYNPQALCAAWTEPVLPPPEKRLVLCNSVTCRMVQAGVEGNDGKVSLRDLSPVAVVVGLDLHFNMLKLAVASMVLQGPPPGCVSPSKKAAATVPALFIATNEDPQIPIGKDNILLPGAGGMVRSLVAVSGREPDAVCGKPNIDMATILFSTEHIPNPKEQCLMIGDRLTTDVAFGNLAGCQSMLVLSGAEGMADVEKATEEGNQSLIPDYIGDSLACFLPLSLCACIPQQLAIHQKKWAYSLSA